MDNEKARQRAGPFCKPQKLLVLLTALAAALLTRLIAALLLLAGLLSTLLLAALLATLVALLVLLLATLVLAALVLLTHFVFLTGELEVRFNRALAGIVPGTDINSSLRCGVRDRLY